ncbi:DUF2442 domain-containing protein [Cyanobacterium sp. Dongsha4]|uniref:DUF2442 domain-containing protein n=1 Tax=Cyanobacterium sp. DS4 TaxID=2878255 RepID=UPI002E7FCE69|nr:DUF2442 domain-containing protein [Cyanobacterium sp. Dongsha4]WVL01363.1 DUF2442 domain-containing protein [Cyanobacterium sp. Dongsha4]
MSILVDLRVKNVIIEDDNLAVEIMDGRTIKTLLAWFPRLFNASKQQLNNWQISGGGYGIHWEEIDEDISVEGLLRGAISPDYKKTITTN